MRPIARKALSAQPDERLALLAGEGNEPAFEEIVRRYRDPLTAFATTIVSYHRAEDVVQVSLQRAHEVLIGGERVESLRAWLFAIVRNRALNALRDDPQWSQLDADWDGVPQPPAILEEREELERVVDAICALPEEQRRAIVMREMEGEGHDEIAARLHTSPTTVRGLIFRARRTLRTSMGALVPLPLLRWLLADPAAAGAVGAAGAAGGGALMAGTTGKLAVAITTAVITIGAGTALQDQQGDGSAQADGSASTPNQQVAPGTGSTGPGAGDGPAAEDRSAGDDGSDASSEEAAERARERAEESREAQREAAEEQRERQEEAREREAERAEEARENAQEQAEAEQEAAEEAAEQQQEAAEAAQEQAEAQQEAAAEAAEEAAEAQQEAAEEARDD